MRRHDKSHGGSRYGWRWMLVLGAAFAWLSIGCSPQTISYFILPFMDNNNQPECKALAAEKEFTLVILSNFSDPPFKQEYAPAAHELAEQVGVGLRKRCVANKQTVKIVPQLEVRNHYTKLLSEDGDLSPVSIGKKFKADYVLDLTIDRFSLYQEKSPLYQGTARIGVKLYQVNPKDGEHLVFPTTYLGNYTGRRGVILDVGSMNPADFRQMFMRKMGQELSRYFVPYSQDELKEWD